jgi:hypothetical protein
MKHLILVVVMMITSTFTFSQDISKNYLGKSLNRNISHYKSLNYQFVEEDSFYAKFFVPNNNETYDFDITLLLFASPESKTVWFGIMTFDTENKKEKKTKFSSMVKEMKKIYGKPYKKNRKVVKWDVNGYLVYVENLKSGVKYTVINTETFFKVEGEFN